MKLYLNFDQYAKTGGGTFVDYSDALLDDGFARKSCFGAEGKAEIQTVQMRLKPVSGLTPLAVNILTAEHDIRARLLKDDDTPYFIGTIRPYVTGEVREAIKPISVEVLDDTKYLESYIFTADSTLSANLKVISATPADSLIHWLVAKCTVKNSAGVYVRAFEDADIVIDVGVDTDVDADGLTVDTGNWVNAILDKVCYEYGLQYRCTPDGKLHIAKALPTLATETAAARALTDANMRRVLTPKRSDDSRQGAVVTYYPVVYGDCLVAEHSIMDTRFADDKTYVRGYEWLNTDEPGGVYPPAAYQEVRLSKVDLEKRNREILRYDTATLRAAIKFHDGSKDTRQSLASITSNGDGTYDLKITVSKNKTKIERLYAVCKCWYVDKDDEHTTSVHPGPNPEEYEAKYLHDAVSAALLLKSIVLRTSTGGLSYTFDATVSDAYTPGELVSIASTALGVTGVFRVVSVTDHGDSRTNNLVSVVLESVTALEDVTVDTTEQVVSYLTRLGSMMLGLRSSTPAAKYEPVAGTVEFTAYGDAIETLGATLTWELNGTPLVDTTESVTIDHADMIVGDNVIRVVATVSGIDMGDTPLEAETTVALVVDGEDGDDGAPGTPAPRNFGGVDTVPADPVTGDYFLWIGETGTYTKGEIYEWSGSAWVESTNGNLVMSLIEDLIALGIGLVVGTLPYTTIKNFVAMNAFIKNLTAENLEVINSLYSAKINSTDGVKIVNNGVTLLEAPPTGGLSIEGELQASYGAFGPIIVGKFNPSEETFAVGSDYDDIRDYFISIGVTPQPPAKTTAFVVPDPSYPCACIYDGVVYTELFVHYYTSFVLPPGETHQFVSFAVQAEGGSFIEICAYDQTYAAHTVSTKEFVLKAIFTASLITTAKIVPSQDLSFDLGSTTRRFKDLHLSGNASVGEALTASTINTGNGATEIYDMNQDLKTTDSPTFAGLTVTGNLVEQSTTQWTLGSQAINHGATYTLPKGSYIFYRVDPVVSMVLQVKDASTWYNTNAVYNLVNVVSDGTNMRLINASEDTNATVYWRKKP